MGGFLVARPSTAQRGTLGCEDLRAGSAGSCAVVAETLTHCDVFCEYPVGSGYRPWTAESARSVTGSAITFSGAQRERAPCRVSSEHNVYELFSTNGEVA